MPNHSPSWRCVAVGGQGFQYSSLLVVPFHFSCLGGLPVHLVLVSPCKHGLQSHCWSCVSLPHSCALLGASQSPILVSPMYTHSVLAWNFVDNTLSSESCFTCARVLLRVPLDQQTVFTPNGWHALSILLLRPGTYGRSSRGCPAGLGGVGRRGLASKVSLDPSLRIPIGPEHLSQVFDLLPLRAAITHLLSSVP